MSKLRHKCKHTDTQLYCQYRSMTNSNHWKELYWCILGNRIWHRPNYMLNGIWTFPKTDSLNNLCFPHNIQWWQVACFLMLILKLLTMRISKQPDHLKAEMENDCWRTWSCYSDHSTVSVTWVTHFELWAFWTYCSLAWFSDEAVWLKPNVLSLVWK